MARIIETIVSRLELVSRTFTGAVAPWQAWLDEPLGISPWQAWTLMGLVRHRPRQQFVHEVVVERLQGSPAALAIEGAFAHPEIPRQGIVPGLPAWEYYFHGRGCCLTHRTTGESIDVDFLDSTSEYIDGFFYVRYLQSLKNPQYVEDRLLCLPRPRVGRQKSLSLGPFPSSQRGSCGPEDGGTCQKVRISLPGGTLRANGRHPKLGAAPGLLHRGNVG